MVELEEGLQQLQAEFSEAGIVTDSPGFYEDFPFIRCERKDPTYFDNYARFVQWQDYHAAYLDKAERVIHVVVAEMQLALQLDGTSDGYAETPLVMSRILEREGIWNYVVRGALERCLSSGVRIRSRLVLGGRRRPTVREAGVDTNGYSPRRSK